MPVRSAAMESAAPSTGVLIPPYDSGSRKRVNRCCENLDSLVGSWPRWLGPWQWPLFFPCCWRPAEGTIRPWPRLLHVPPPLRRSPRPHWRPGQPMRQSSRHPRLPRNQLSLSPRQRPRQRIPRSRQRSREPLQRRKSRTQRQRRESRTQRQHRESRTQRKHRESRTQRQHRESRTERRHRRRPPLPQSPAKATAVARSGTARPSSREPRGGSTASL